MKIFHFIFSVLLTTLLNPKIRITSTANFYFVLHVRPQHSSCKICGHLTSHIWILMTRRLWKQWMVGWLEFNVPFPHKYGYIRDKRSGVESYPLTQWRKASDILTSTQATFLFSSHPKRERDREAHLNYYASAYNSRRQLSHHKTKLSQIQQKTTIILN